MIKEAIDIVVKGKSLNMEQAAQVMNEIMEGEATPAQFGAFVTALRLKGETVHEIAGMARVMREKSVPVKVKGPLVDTCGTGGDGTKTFNISTTAAFVVAGAGVKVAKHGNRGMSSGCGSADVLDALGVKYDIDAAGVERCMEEIGIGFMFAPRFHPAMKFAVNPRREIGIRTVFNILGPMTNPARAQSQLLGVFDDKLALIMAEVLGLLGCGHALVVHGEDGMDEITLGGKTTVCELKNGEVSRYHIDPEDFGFKRTSIDKLRGGSPKENGDILRCVLHGEKGAYRDITLLNAAAALVAADLAKDLKEGVKLAAQSIDSYAAMKKLDGLRELTQSL
ncbi:MAG: anthranilate phosphoribosyltransferase [Dehalococcoidia bacterium]|jgi:anthranilate phosphoribosyltransferase